MYWVGRPLQSHTVYSPGKRKTLHPTTHQVFKNIKQYYNILQTKQHPVQFLLICACHPHFARGIPLSSGLLQITRCLPSGDSEINQLWFSEIQ